MTDNEAQIIAKKIAEDLFTEGVTGQRATRLALESEGECLSRNLSGWSEDACANRIEEMLRELHRPTSVSDEISAMIQVANALAGKDVAACARILNWANDLFATEPPVTE